ncbi:hypothetical protein D3C86_1847290 [compost metagenome]
MRGDRSQLAGTVIQKHLIDLELKGWTDPAGVGDCQQLVGEGAAVSAFNGNYANLHSLLFYLSDQLLRLLGAQPLSRGFV